MIDLFPVANNLDSTLKKNTAFIRKIRTSLNEANLQSLLKDISTLSLVKYLSEIISSLIEGLVHCKSTGDLLAGVEVSSALFQRFGIEFSGPFLSSLLHGIENLPKSQLKELSSERRAREVKNKFQQQRVLIRIVIELCLEGVFRSATDAIEYELPEFALIRNPDLIFINCLMEILSGDLVTFAPCQIGIEVIKSYKFDILGSENVANNEEASKLVYRDTQLKCQKMFATYARGLNNFTRSKVKSLIGLENLIEDRYLKFGKVSSDQEQKYNELLAHCETLKAHCEELHSLLGLELEPIELSSSKTIKENGGKGAGNWEDIYEKRFYEDLVILVPKKEEFEDDLIDDEQKGTENSKENTESESENIEDLTTLPESKISEQITDDDKAFEFKETDTKEEIVVGDVEETPANGEKMIEILLLLKAKPSKETADLCALEFKSVNNRASRRKVRTFFLHIETHQQYKLPFYVRFLATIAPITPDIIPPILKYLEDYYSYIVKRPTTKLYLARLFVMTYFSEMIKFKLVPKKLTFHLLHAAIRILSHHTVEIISIMLERCGRYLYRNPDTHVLLLKYIDYMKDQQAKRNLPLDDKQTLMNALSYVNPPPSIVIEAKRRPLIEHYIRKLIYVDLDNSNSLDIFKQLMKFDWEDKDTLHSLRKVFCKIWKVKQENIVLMARFMESIKLHYPSFAVFVIDSILEDIRVGLEKGGYKNNQKRISQVTYLGELYNNGIVKQNIIMSTLYLILTFGYPNNQPTPQGCLLDPSDELFRIRLACSLLDSSGKKLRKSEREVDIYMYFLQYFIKCKKKMSIDVEFQIRDTFKLMRPHMPIYTKFETASQALKDVIAGRQPQPEPKPEIFFDEDEGDSTSTADDIGRDAKYYIPKAEDSETPEEREKRLVREARQNARRLERENQKAINDFEAEFQSMMLDRYGGPQRGAASQFDLPVPKNGSSSVGVTDANGMIDPKKVKYRLLTKKANRPEVRGINLPENSRFIERINKERENMIKTQERIRNIVLRYESANQNDNNDTILENDPLNLRKPPKPVQKLERSSLTTEKISKLNTVD